MVELGHKAGMKVMGYFTLGANPYWEKLHPDLVHGSDTDYIRIPMTLEYLDYFCRSVEDAMLKTGVDGFMIDWVRPTQHKTWLPCEKEMYRQLARREVPRVGPALGRGGAGVRPAGHGAGLAAHPMGRPGHRPGGHLDQSSVPQEGIPAVDRPPPAQGGGLGPQRGPGPRSPGLAAASRSARETLIVQNLCGWEGHDA